MLLRDEGAVLKEEVVEAVSVSCGESVLRVMGLWLVDGRRGSWTTGGVLERVLDCE